MSSPVFLYRLPHLWFDTEAEQAVDFYKNVFPETEIIKKVTLQDISVSGKTFL
jgi:predicted 3-demethylubiquinone-9 3-methyltransferase (glyoxalase superfamily)